MKQLMRIIHIISILVMLYMLALFYYTYSKKSEAPSSPKPVTVTKEIWNPELPQEPVVLSKFVKWAKAEPTDINHVQVDCLARNIYYEARNQSRDGQIAVALVTLNRVENKRFPNSICDVVYQKSISKINGKLVCQFSWVCQSGLPKMKQAIYNRIKEVAIYAYKNNKSITDITNGSINYHADYVNPDWSNLKKTVTIGNHIFYKPKYEKS